MTSVAAATTSCLPHATRRPWSRSRSPSYGNGASTESASTPRPWVRADGIRHEADPRQSRRTEKDARHDLSLRCRRRVGARQRRHPALVRRRKLRYRRRAERRRRTIARPSAGTTRLPDDSTHTFPGAIQTPLDRGRPTLCLRGALSPHAKWPIRARRWRHPPPSSITLARP
jgi:hypothetical protein